MTTAEVTVPMYSGTFTAETFILHGQAIENLLTSCGLVLVSDPIDWEAVTMPAAAPLPICDPLIFKFNDGITPELYFKIVFLKATTGTTNLSPALRIHTSISSDLISWTNAVSSSYLGVYDCMISYSCSFIDSSLTLLYFPQTALYDTYPHSALIIERTRDVNDEVTGTGAVLITMGLTTTNTSISTATYPQYRSLHFATKEENTDRTCVSWGYSAPAILSSVTNNILHAYPATTWVKSDAWALRSLVYVSDDYVGTLAEIYVTVGEETRTYRSSRSTNLTYAGVNANARVMFRFD